MKSPIHAMLWEMWRVTRVEAALRLALGTIAGMAVMTLMAFVSEREDTRDFFAAVALVLILVPHFLWWQSMAKFVDERRGFPLYRLYTRPVRTAMIVGLPMAYLTVVSWATYLVSALALRVTSGHAFPLLPVAGWMAALTLIVTALTWSTQSRVIRLGALACVTFIGFVVAMRRLTAVEIDGGYDWPPRLWPTLFDFPLTDYALICAIGLVAFGLAVASVARERRGGRTCRPPVMNDLELTVALVRAPSSAFAELRESPRSWFPLLLLVLTTAGLGYWYYITVDWEWLQAMRISANPERAESIAGISRNERLWSTLIGAVISFPFFFGLHAVYLLLAAQVTKLLQDFEHWFALVCWSSLPGLLGSVVSVILLMQADSSQMTDSSVLNPLSLNELLDQRTKDSPGRLLFEVLNIPAFLSWALMIIGVRSWSRRSWVFSATFVLLPWVVICGVSGYFAFR